MKKTFDELFAEILGENVPPVAPQPTTTTTPQNQQYQKTPSPTQPKPQQAEVPEEIAKLFIAAKTPQEVNAAYLKLQQMNQQTQNAAATKPA